MIKRYAFKDNSGKLHYRTKHTIENMKQTPGFSYELLHWWSWNYWRILLLHRKLIKHGMPAMIDTRNNTAVKNKHLEKRVAFRDNSGKLHFRSNRTLEKMKEDSTFSYVKLSRFNPAHWKARRLRLREVREMDTTLPVNKTPDTGWGKRVVFIDSLGKIVYSTEKTLDKLKQTPGFNYELVPKWKLDYWRVCIPYWVNRIMQWRGMKTIRYIVLGFVFIYLVLFLLHKIPRRIGTEKEQLKAPTEDQAIPVQKK